MAHSKHKTRKPAYVDIYQTVTDSIIKHLEAGCVPWVKPWGRPDVSTPLGMPTNGHTNRQYTGVNVLLLWGAAIDTKRTTQTWLTYKQALDLGGRVRKGERGTTVCYANAFTPKAEKERAFRDGDTAQSIGFLKRYTVFNADQCEGLDPIFFENVAPLPDCETIPHIENLMKSTGAKYRTGGDRAFYSVDEDYIQMPPQPAFFKQIDYYRTFAHELSHWTGSKERLNRNQSGTKGSKPYAREELVAEMSSAFLCAALGIAPTMRHANYLSLWLRVLRDDKRAIFRAASQASKAANYILASQNPISDHPQTIHMPIPKPHPKTPQGANVLVSEMRVLETAA